MAVRACLDSNLFISYLLNPLRDTPPATILRAGLRQQFSIVFGTRITEEVLKTISNKQYLREHIPRSEVDELLALLHEAGEFIMDEPGTIRAICRDPKDNYLLAYATLARVDLLVSGDHDLLALGGEFEGVRIVSPAAFAALIDQID